jgi:hypothetical protein
MPIHGSVGLSPAHLEGGIESHIQPARLVQRSSARWSGVPRASYVDEAKQSIPTLIDRSLWDAQPSQTMMGWQDIASAARKLDTAEDFYTGWRLPPSRRAERRTRGSAPISSPRSSLSGTRFARSRKLTDGCAHSRTAFVASARTQRLAGEIAMSSTCFTNNGRLIDLHSLRSCARSHNSSVVLLTNK